ncbi:MAG: GAF domain-containing protein [Candidatus Bathyarchaeia archaeon]
MKSVKVNGQTDINFLIEELGAIMDLVDEIIYVIDMENYKVLFANEKAEDVFGEGIRGRKCHEVFYGLNTPCPFCTNEQLSKHGRACIREQENRKSGKWYKCIDTVVKLPNGKHVRFGMAIDITKQKEAEEALRENEKRYKSIFEYSPISLWEEDFSQVKNYIENLRASGIRDFKVYFKEHPEAVNKCIEMVRIIDVNKATLRLYKAENKKQLITGGLKQILDDESREMFAEELVAIADCKTKFTCETVTKTLTGEKKYVTLIWSVAPGYEQSLERVFVSKIDVTKQKRLEKTLRENGRLFRSIVENSHDCILIVDDNFKITYVNYEVQRLGGYSKGEVLGQDFRKFLDEESKEAVEDIYLRRQRGEWVPSTYKFRIICKDGTKKDVEAKSTVLRSESGKTFTVAQLLDVTESKKMDEERRQFTEKLSALNMYGQSLNMAKSMEEIYKLTLDAMLKTLGFDFADIFIIDGSMLRLAMHRGYSKVLKLDLPLDGKKGITVKAARTGKTVLVPDVRKDKAYIKGGEEILSELVVPIKVGRKVLGVLNVESQKLAAFSMHDIELLEILASHAATAIINLRVRKTLSALNEYGRNLNKAKSMNEIYKLTLDAIEEILGFEYASILMVKGKKLDLVAHRGYSKVLSLKLPLDGDKGITVKAAKTGKPIIVPDVSKEKAYVEGGENIRSELAVPIKMRGNVIGVLNVESRRAAAFDEEDKKLLETLASHAATAISNIERREELKALSDKITNLMKSSTKIMHIKDMRQRLKAIAKAIQQFGWRRVVISLTDENLDRREIVTAGLTAQDRRLLMKRRAPGHVWQERLGPKFEKYRIGEFYYLPWNDPWVREHAFNVPPGTPTEVAITIMSAVPSRLPEEEMVDWHPQDMVYAPLRTPNGRIVGLLSMDDPIDGKRPTKESLAPLELFLHQAAITIENAQLIENLEEAKKQLEEYADQLEQKVEERTRELKKSQEQLLKTQRLAVIGELAGMVGHDLRNPLTSIAGAQYYLKKRLNLEANDKIREMLELIEKNIAYANKIINDLLDYSREIELELIEKTPKSLVAEALSLVEIPKNIEIKDFTTHNPKIKVDPEKIKRVFTNIIKNAVEAMPKGGTLTIKSRKVHDKVEISFTDTGVGMSKETLAKLWTPLFTTKAKGMGFGLPICKRFVEAHKGCITAESTPGKGTTFTVTIPIEPKMEKGGEKVWVKPPESLLSTTTKT